VSTQLRDLLDDLATDARGYSDADLAIATARRRIAIRRVAVPVLAAVLVAALAFAANIVRTDVGPPVGMSPVPTRVAGYPARISEPAHPRPLPKAPGGHAAFLWSPCDYSCLPYLVMEDGRQFVLTRAAGGTPTSDYTLSPDGEWLGLRTSTGYEMRRLTDGRVLSIPDSGWGELSPWAWSPNGEWLLLGRNSAGDVDHFVQIKLGDHGSWRRVAPPADVVVAMDNDGALIGWVSPGDRPQSLPELTIVRNGESTVARRFTVRLPPNSRDLIRKGEVIDSFRLRLGPDGQSGLLVLEHPTDPFDSWPARTGVLTVDLNLGEVTGRIDLPVPGGGQSARRWEVRANLAGGVLLVHWTPGRTELVVLNTVTGQRVVATTFPADADVSARAATWA
jgi:hypothetical protein